MAKSKPEVKKPEEKKPAAEPKAAPKAPEKTAEKPAPEKAQSPSRELAELLVDSEEVVNMLLRAIDGKADRNTCVQRGEALLGRYKKLNEKKE